MEEVTLSLNEIKTLKRQSVIDIEHWVYFLWKANTLVYVGYTSTGMSRISAHIGSIKDFDSFSHLCFKEASEALAAEKRYIRAFKPLYNGGYGSALPKVLNSASLINKAAVYIGSEGILVTISSQTLYKVYKIHGNLSAIKDEAGNMGFLATDKKKFMLILFSTKKRMILGGVGLKSDTKKIDLYRQTPNVVEEAIRTFCGKIPEPYYSIVKKKLYQETPPVDPIRKRYYRKYSNRRSISSGM